MKNYEHESIMKCNAIDSNQTELENKVKRIEELKLEIDDLKSEVESTKENEIEKEEERS